MDLKTIKLDGVEYQAEAEVIKTINGLQTKLDDASATITVLKTDLSTIEAERDTLKDSNAELREENDSLKASKLDETQIQERVKSLVRVQRVAEHLGVEVKDGASEVDIMKETVLAKFPKANFDGKDEVYIRARFDSVAESIEFNTDEQTRIVAQGSVTKDDDQVESAEEARKRMIKERMDASRAEL
jgi:FtsZ-binding cell division protein ZapB